MFADLVQIVVDWFSPDVVFIESRFFTKAKFWLMYSSLALLIPHCSCSFGSLLFLFLLITVLVTCFILVAWTPKQRIVATNQIFGNSHRQEHPLSRPDVFRFRQWTALMNSSQLTALQSIPSACGWTPGSFFADFTARVSLVKLGPTLSFLIWTLDFYGPWNSRSLWSPTSGCSCGDKNPVTSATGFIGIVRNHHSMLLVDIMVLKLLAWDKVGMIDIEPTKNDTLW